MYLNTVDDEVRMLVTGNRAKKSSTLWDFKFSLNEYIHIINTNTYIHIHTPTYIHIHTHIIHITHKHYIYTHTQT